jgi:hypothetical protein
VAGISIVVGATVGDWVGLDEAAPPVVAVGVGDRTVGDGVRRVGTGLCVGFGFGDGVWVDPDGVGLGCSVVRVV